MKQIYDRNQSWKLLTWSSCCERTRRKDPLTDETEPSSCDPFSGSHALESQVHALHQHGVVVQRSLQRPPGHAERQNEGSSEFRHGLEEEINKITSCADDQSFLYSSRCSDRPRTTWRSCTRPCRKRCCLKITAVKERPWPNWQVTEVLGRQLEKNNN